MRLIHYSREPLKKMETVEQRALTDDSTMLQRAFPKPRGLWLSVDDDWERWCKDEDFSLGCLRSRTEIVLVDDANVLRLKGADDIDAFSAEFAYDPLKLFPNGSKYGVRWDLVASRWQGIIIAPYCWERRLTEHTFWYYGWDCASGCIWDAAAVGSLKPLKRPLRERLQGLVTSR